MDLTSQIKRTRHSNAMGIIAAFVIFLVVLACGGGKPAPADYVGHWTGGDGSTIDIRADGSGDYEGAGAVKTTVSGGTVDINETAKTLSIKFMRIGPDFTIDKAPSGNQMTLSGIVYKKNGGSGSKSDSKPDTDSNGPSAEVPSNDKLQSIVKSTMNDFADAVRTDDVGSFRDTFSKNFKDSVSDDDLRSAFKDFIAQKDKLDVGKAIAKLDATFEPAPSIVKNSNATVLKVAGYYPTTPKRLRFKFDYAMEDGAWKLSFVKLDTEDSK